MFNRFQRNGFRPLFFFKTQIHSYCTAADAVKSQPYFYVDFFVNSLGFSKEEALSLVKEKYARKFCIRDPNIVVNFLKTLGLNKNQIKSVVSADTRVLSYDVDKTLRPKIRVFQDLGLSGSDIIGLIMHHKSILCRGSKQILPAIEYLRKLLGTDENVAKVITRFSPLLNSYSTVRVISANVELLKRVGFSNEDVSRFVIRNPRRILQSPEELEKKLRILEHQFGLFRDSKMFYYGVEAVSSASVALIDLKLKAFRSYGWSDDAIYRLIRALPFILNFSDAKIRQALCFYMEELGYTADYLASRPVFFTMSFQKRVIPRNEVLKFLNEKGLCKRKLSLYSALCLSEPKFLDRCIAPYKDQLPDLYELYMETAKKIKERKLPFE